MPMIIARACFATLGLTCLALLPLAAAAAQTATPAPQDNKASSATSEGAHDIELKGDDDLYILKDLPEPTQEPNLDLGKVGKKGKLSLESMPLESAGEYDRRRRGAGGVRLKIPLGKQAP